MGAHRKLRKLGELLSACAALVLFMSTAVAQLYPYPTTTPLTQVVGPSAPVVGNVPIFGSPVASFISVTDSGVAISSIKAPQVSVCPSHQYFFSYPTLAGAISCKQPVTADLSDINTFNLSTTGSATVGSLTTAGMINAGPITGSSGIIAGTLAVGAWTITGGSSSLSFQSASSANSFGIDSSGFPIIPTAVKGSGVPVLGLGSGLPYGAHPTVQVWFEVKDATGATRYVPGF